ncbi:hypothetical protein [Tardiphaga sp.]|uniref:hypothetical protein n=1 Tax=Tardiphaga sp. TaxID=1926292 RepID=UPI0025DEB3FC|nr:hypothetical protein [Tardiphaga sp.]
MIDRDAIWHAHQRARFMRPDVARFMRPDAARDIRPDVARFLKPGSDPADVYLALKYSPTQRRIPAGRPGGGRWTNETEGGGGGSGDISFGNSGDGPLEGSEDVAATGDMPLGFAEPESSGGLDDWNSLLGSIGDDPRPIPNANPDDFADNLEEVAGGTRGRGGPTDYFPGATPGQLVRLDQAVARPENALTQIRRYEPSWQPRDQSIEAPGSINGAISTAEARAVYAESYLTRLRTGIGGNYGPRWISCLELVRRRELSTAGRGSISIVLSTTRQTCLATRSGPKTKTLLP